MSLNPKKNLVPGFNLLAIFGKNQYHAIVAGTDTKNEFFIRLTKPDQKALYITPNSSCIVQCVSDDGFVYKFECKASSIKIPLIGLSYPEENIEGLNIRKSERVSVSYWVALLGVVDEDGKSILKPVGEGTIVDVTEGGCKLMSNGKYKVNDPLYLSVEYEENKKPLLIKGKIRQIRPAPHGLNYYRTQFDNPDPASLNIIRDIIKDSLP